jgi:hypothetical protein
VIGCKKHAVTAMLTFKLSRPEAKQEPVARVRHFFKPEDKINVLLHIHNFQRSLQIFAASNNMKTFKSKMRKRIYLKLDGRTCTTLDEPGHSSESLTNIMAINTAKFYKTAST